MNNRLFFILCIAYFNSIACTLSLDTIALQTGTDKSSQYHNYTELYENYFNQFRNSKIKFLEIGIDYCHSVKMWDQYFENSESNLYFLDINKQYVDLCHTLVASAQLTQRVIPYQADQSITQQLANFVTFAGSDFDIIIDDGGHTMTQQITSFQALFPHVKTGGVYIIEDLHTSFWPNWGGGLTKTNEASSSSTIAFLAELIHKLNFAGGMTGSADIKKCPQSNFKDYFQAHIKSMHFYNSICFIFKN